MAELKIGKVVEWRPLSPTLAIFRLAHATGAPFPDYKPGQYMALRREGCRLTRRVIGQDGRPHFVPDVDESGQQKRGPVTHSYSISSAPFETRAGGLLEFYVVLETGEGGSPGRLTDSLFHIRPHEDDDLEYVNRIVGDFTLDKRAAGFRSVLLVGTGTGLAPFASMVKQLDAEAAAGAPPDIRYTLLHTNRTREELAYDAELRALEASGRLDFLYLASVSRPTPADRADPTLGIGRANNLLRHVFGMPLKEEEDLRRTQEAGGDALAVRAALDKATKPALPRHLDHGQLRRRLAAAETVILTCGNPSLMADVKAVADANGIRFEKEDW